MIICDLLYSYSKNGYLNLKYFILILPSIIIFAYYFSAILLFIFVVFMTRLSILYFYILFVVVSAILILELSTLSLFTSIMPIHIFFFYSLSMFFVFMATSAIFMIVCFFFLQLHFLCFYLLYLY